MLVATCFVVVMTLPGLALFYGGLVRSKNVLSVLMQVLTVFSIVSILWVIYGYTMAFTGNASAGLNPFVGGLSKFLLVGVGTASEIGTFSKETNIPELAFVIFQMTFACITPALIVGAYAERMKFSAVLLFMVMWFTFAYLPMAHMVWFWAGPDAYTLSADNLPLISSIVGADKAKQLLDALAAAATDDAKAAVLAEYGALVNATNGYLFNLGALDFAGGTVVHINAGVAGLVCCHGARQARGLWTRRADAPQPHLRAHRRGPAAVRLVWLQCRLEPRGERPDGADHPQLHHCGGRSGPVLDGGRMAVPRPPEPAGRRLRPGCGSRGHHAGLRLRRPRGAIAIGFAAGIVCLWSVVVLKTKLGYDDALDVFGVHGTGGILGALLTGVFVNPALGGSGVTDYLAADATAAVAAYSFSGQMYAQFMAVIVAIVWTSVVSFVALMICKATVGLRVKEQDEREGLDLVDHGERAYN